MSCKCHGRRRRRCNIACKTFVAGTNGCSNFNNVLVACGFRDHDCRGTRCGRDRHRD